MGARPLRGRRGEPELLPTLRRRRGSEGSSLVGARPLRGRRGEPALLPTLRRRHGSGGSSLVGARPLRGRRGELALLAPLRRLRTHLSAAHTAPNNRHTPVSSDETGPPPAPAGSGTWPPRPFRGALRPRRVSGAFGAMLAAYSEAFHASQRSARGVVGSRCDAPRATFYFAAKRRRLGRPSKGRYKADPRRQRAGSRRQLRQRRINSLLDQCAFMLQRRANRPERLGHFTLVRRVSPRISACFIDRVPVSTARLDEI